MKFVARRESVAVAVQRLDTLKSNLSNFKSALLYLWYYHPPPPNTMNLASVCSVAFQLGWLGKKENVWPHFYSYLSPGLFFFTGLTSAVSSCSNTNIPAVCGWVMKWVQSMWSFVSCCPLHPVWACMTDMCQACHDFPGCSGWDVWGQGEMEAARGEGLRESVIPFRLFCFWHASSPPYCPSASADDWQRNCSATDRSASRLRACLCLCIVCARMACTSVTAPDSAMSPLCKLSTSTQWWWDVAVLAFNTVHLCPLPFTLSGSTLAIKCWLLSKNLISQMEKQHLLSYSFTYGSHSCSHELKQVCRVGGWPLGTLNRGPGPGDSVGTLCSEGHALPSQMNLHMKWGHGAQRARDHEHGGEQRRLCDSEKIRMGWFSVNLCTRRYVILAWEWVKVSSVVSLQKIKGFLALLGKNWNQGFGWTLD